MPLPDGFAVHGAEVALLRNSERLRPEESDYCSHHAIVRSLATIESDDSRLRIQCTVRPDPIASCTGKLMHCEHGDQLTLSVVLNAAGAIGHLTTPNGVYLIRARSTADAWMVRLWRVRRGEGLRPHGPPTAAGVLTENALTLLIDEMTTRTMDRGPLLFAAAQLARLELRDRRDRPRGTR
jgi:hypothetical protein